MEIYFERDPKAINGIEYSPLALVEKLNEIGGQNGVGITDMVENRLVGIKSAAFMNAPAVQSFTTPTVNWSGLP